jgi:hypothetical protein
MIRDIQELFVLQLQQKNYDKIISTLKKLWYFVSNV